MEIQNNDQPAEAPLISVVIPVYNAEKYLEKCLDSVLASSLSGIEVICVDDGSEDRSLQILNAYRQKDSRVRVLTQQHLFAGAARNAGIRAAAGKYIHFLDSDDEVTPGAYEKLYRTAEAAEAEVCECLYINTNAETGEIMSRPKYRPVDERLPLRVSSGGETAASLIYGHVVPWNKLYLREFLTGRDIYFDGLICAEDRSFYFDVIFKAERIVRITERLVKHRRCISSSLDGSDIRARHFDVEFRSFERIWEIIGDAPNKIKAMVLDCCVADCYYWYQRVIGTEYDAAVRDQLRVFWQPYLPVLGTGIRKTWWCMWYVGLRVEKMPGLYGRFTRFLYCCWEKTSKHPGPLAYLARRACKATLLRLPNVLIGK